MNTCPGVSIMIFEGDIDRSSRAFLLELGLLAAKPQRVLFLSDSPGAKSWGVPCSLFWLGAQVVVRFAEARAVLCPLR